MHVNAVNKFNSTLKRCVSCTLSNNNNDLEPFLIRHRVQHELSIIKCQVAVFFSTLFIFSPFFFFFLLFVWYALRATATVSEWRLHVYCVCFFPHENDLRVKQRKWRWFFFVACFVSLALEYQHQDYTIESTIKIICCHRRDYLFSVRFAHLQYVCIWNNINK